MATARSGMGDRWCGCAGCVWATADRRRLDRSRQRRRHYLFLAGMMLIAELARSEGLFEWLAGIAASHARGSAKRLFPLIYIVGIVVTGVSFERRHGRRTDAGRVCLCERGTRRAPALSLNLRVHRQCRELRAADF